MLSTTNYARNANIFSLSEELINSNLKRGGELLMTPKEIEKKLNSIEDQLIDDPRNIIYDSLYFELKDFLNVFDTLTMGSKLKLVGLIQSSWAKYLDNLRVALNSGKSGFEASQWRSACEMYAVLVYQAVFSAESATNSASSSNNNSNSVPTSKSTKASSNFVAFDWSHIRIALLESLKDFVGMSLGRIFDSSADKESIIGAVVKAAHRVLENPENAIKSLNTRKASIEVLSECARGQGYLQGLKTFILQDLVYSEHLAEPIAELFKILYDTEDTGCIELCEEVLKAVGSQRFNSQESSTSTKSAAIFLTKFASICSKEALHTLSLFIDQLDSEAYVMRMAMVEVLGVLIYFLMTQEDRSDGVKTQTKSLFAALEERFHDVNSFVRSKTLQVCCDLAKSSSIPITKRPKLLELAAERVMDKSSNVRRKAIQLLGDFLKTHPFGVDGGELNLTFFQSRLTDIERILAEIAPNLMMDDSAAADRSMSLDTFTSDSPRMSVAVDNSAQLGSLLAQKQYYCDAIKFVSAINTIIPTVCALLSSTTKTEVFEVMEFLVEAHIYKLESSEAGIRKMLHLIWERELSSEDGTKQSIREHLIEAYRRIYLFADPELPVKERPAATARSLISLVDGISIAELASLTELITCFVKKSLIPEAVIQQIFNHFSSSEFDKRSRRGALVLISILARSRRDLVEKRLEVLLKLGLGPLGQSDPLIAQYTLIALEMLHSSSQTRIPVENVLFTRIRNFLSTCCISSRWHAVISQAIITIYSLADRPVVLLNEILAEEAKELFSFSSENSISSKAKLGKLLLMIGQVAAGISEHLDVVERHGKESAQKLDAQDQNGDLAKVSASAEDDFAELVKGVREQEILFDPNGMLSVLGPLVASICIHNTTFTDVKIQRLAALALARLMTISAAFCEQNLQLFLTILEKSVDPIIRSNLVIAFGDLTQCFNALIDQNIDYLFHRLQDSDLTVRRNTLMVLTHLSLCGMIKVKGQIGEIAKCLIDEDSRIRNLARIFFAEMADRDTGTVGGSGIYNHIPDILSHLSSNGQVPEEAFRTIMKFIFEFIKKEKQMEGLIEKLCSRFRNSDSIRHARDLAFCLSLISFSGDRSLKKLAESFPLYQDKLVDDVVLGSFVEILQRSKKFCKAEMKPLIDEFENRLLQAANREGISNASITSFAALSQSIAKSQRASSAANSSASSNKSKSTKKNSSRRRKHVDYEGVSDEDDADFDEDGLDDEIPIKKSSRKPVVRQASQRSQKKRVVMSDDEEDEGDANDNNDIF